MEIKVGHRYKNGDGDTIVIMFELTQENSPEYFSDHADYPFIGYNKRSGSWAAYSDCGYYNRFETTDEDLVEEIQDTL